MIDDDRQAQLRARFIEKRGYWSPRWDILLPLDTNFFEAYTEFSGLDWRKQKGLDQKTREFLYVAIDASTTHLYDTGTRVHMQNAIRLGASQREILEILEMAALMGIQSALVGATILREELEARGIKQKPLDANQLKEKQMFIDNHGYWTDGWEAILQISPSFMRASRLITDVPKNNARLDEKTRAFINIALNAAVTHLNVDATRSAIKVALDLGADQDEIMEVLEVISVLGIHGCSHNLPMLVEQFKAADQ